MKKKNFKNLTLHKESISNFEKKVLKGGWTGSCLCGPTSECPPAPTMSVCCHE